MSMIHDITATRPRNKVPRRKGRGESSGRGKTCGRGHKGAKARAGRYVKPGHEGGQTQIFRRFPKRGFSNADFERRYYIVNLSDLERFDDGSTVDTSVLMGAGLVPDEKQPVKVLGNGGLSKKLTVMAGWYSRSARQRIVEAGGSAQNLKGETFEFPGSGREAGPKAESAGANETEQAPANEPPNE